jgi:hypothetical protein
MGPMHISEIFCITVGRLLNNRIYWLGQTLEGMIYTHGGGVQSGAVTHGLVSYPAFEIAGVKRRPPNIEIVWIYNKSLREANSVPSHGSAHPTLLAQRWRFEPSEVRALIV